MREITIKQCDIDKAIRLHKKGKYHCTKCVVANAVSRTTKQRINSMGYTALSLMSHGKLMRYNLTGDIPSIRSIENDSDNSRFGNIKPGLTFRINRHPG